MDPGTLGTVAAIIGGVVTKLGDIILQRYRERREDSATDRKALSEDERAFRAELRDEIKRLREEIDRVSTELQECRTQHLEAQRRISELESKQ